MPMLVVRRVIRLRMEVVLRLSRRRPKKGVEASPPIGRAMSKKEVSFLAEVCEWRRFSYWLSIVEMK